MVTYLLFTSVDVGLNLADVLIIFFFLPYRAVPLSRMAFKITLEF